MSRARRGGAPAWGVELSSEARDWLISRTTDQAAGPSHELPSRSSSRSSRPPGPRVGEPDIKKLVATDELWEARVKDPTGAYRMFFRFGKVGGRRVAAVAYGRKKSEQSFSRSVLDLAQKRANTFLAELGADGFIDQDE